MAMFEWPTGRTRCARAVHFFVRPTSGKMETVERTTQLTVEQVLQRIRIHKETGKGSVLDVIALITGKDDIAYVG